MFSRPNPIRQHRAFSGELIKFERLNQNLIGMKLITLKTTTGIDFSFNPQCVIVLVYNEKRECTEIHLSENLTFLVKEPIAEIIQKMDEVNPNS